MKRRSIYVLIATILSILVPSPGRFVYGVTLVIELNLLMLVGTLAHSLIKKIKLESMETLIVMIMVISTAILYRQIMILFQPEVMFTLGFLIYLMPVSVFLLDIFFQIKNKRLARD